MARQYQTVLVSVVVHVIGLFLLVVIPLLAMDGLPGIPSLTRYVPVDIVAPEEPAPPRLASTAPQAPISIDGPPIEAPPAIAPEAPARPAIADIAGVDGAIGVPGIGTRVDAASMNVPPPPQSPASSEPVRPGGKVKQPERIVYVAPVYPAVAISARIPGTVIIEAVIGTDGAVRDAKVLRSIPLLDAAALAAVRQWRYTPTTLNGVPVAVVMTVSVRFELGG
jgi:protein TonB